MLTFVETQKRRIQTLQELSDSKDRTIKTKEERIQILKKQSGTPKKTETFKYGETVKLHPSCKVYYDHYYKDKKCNIMNLIAGAYAKVYTVVGFKDSKYELCFYSPINNIYFWVDEDKVIPA